MMNMQTHHVCYSRALGCSAVNPCRNCFDAVCVNVLPEVARAFAMSADQARLLRTIFEEAYTRFHDQARLDPALTAAALDLRRVVIAPGEPQTYQDPPAYQAPTWQETPAQYQPPGYQPPAYQQPAYSPPAYQPPTYQPPAYPEPSPVAAPAPPPRVAPQQPSRPLAPGGGQSWPTRARAAAPAPVPADIAALSQGSELESVLSALQNLDPTVLAALASIGAEAAQGRPPAIPEGLDVHALLSGVLPGVDLRSLDIAALAEAFLPPGTDVSEITALVEREMKQRERRTVVDMAPIATELKPEATPDTPEKRAERRAERRRVVDMVPARKPLPAPVPETAHVSADDFASAGEPAPAGTAPEPNGAPKPS